MVLFAITARLYNPPPFAVSTNVSIVDLTGHLTSFVNGALCEALADLLRQGRREILLNAAVCNTSTALESVSWCNAI
jgi:hypothetical protein